MKILSPLRLDTIIVDPPGITFGEIHALIDMARTYGDLFAVLKEADLWLEASLGLVEGGGPPNWDGIREHRRVIAALLDKEGIAQ